MVIAVGVYNIPWLFPVVFDGERVEEDGYEMEQEGRVKAGHEGYNETPSETTS